MELNYKKLVTPEVKHQLEMAIQRVKNGEMAEDVAASIIMEVEKDEQASLDVVDDIEMYIESYFEDSRLSSEDMIRGVLDRKIGCLESPEERCEQYHRLLVMLGAYVAMCENPEEAQHKADAFVREHELFIPQEDLLRQEKELRAAVEEAILNLPLSGAEPDLSDFGLTEEELKRTAAFCLSQSEKEEKYLLLSALVYANTRAHGSTEDEPALTLEQIVYLVCAGGELCDCVASEHTESDESFAHKLLHKLFILVMTVVVTAFLAWVLFALGSFLCMFMSLPLAILSLIALAGAFFLIDREDFVDGVKLYGSMIKESVEGVLMGVTALIKGVVRIVKYTAVSFLNWLKRVFRPGPGDPPGGAGCAMTVEAFDSASAVFTDSYEEERNEEDCDEEYTTITNPNFA